MVTSAGSIQATQPQIIPGAPPQQPGKVLTGDLDSSLASLAENLSINKSASSSMKWVESRTNVTDSLSCKCLFLLRGVQWNSPKNQAKPQSWSPQPMVTTTGANYRPMVRNIQSYLKREMKIQGFMKLYKFSLKTCKYFSSFCAASELSVKGVDSSSIFRSLTFP